MKAVARTEQRLKQSAIAWLSAELLGIASEALRKFIVCLAFSCSSRACPSASEGKAKGCLPAISACPLHCEASPERGQNTAEMAVVCGGT